MKKNGKLGRYDLKGKLGDQRNAVLVAAGHTVVLNYLHIILPTARWLVPESEGMD